MSLQVKRTSVLKIRLISTLMMVMALAAQPMYGFVASQIAAAAPVSTATTSAGFNSVGWAKDRTQPFAYSKTADKMAFTVNNTQTSAPNSSTFYKWEGFKSTTLPASTNTVRASLYIDPAWQNKPVSASMWGVSSNGSDNAWPIIDFSNGYTDSYNHTAGGFVGFRVYDTNTGVWHEVQAATQGLWGTTVDLEITINSHTGMYEFYVNGVDVYEYSNDGYNTLNSVIFDNLNLNTNNAADSYYVKWTNFYTGKVSLNAPTNLHMLDNTHNNYAPLASGVVSKDVDPMQLDLVWDAPTTGATDHYIVTTYKDGTQVGQGWVGTPNSWVGHADMGYGLHGDGTYTFSVVAYDAAGTPSPVATSEAYIYDHNAPEVANVTYNSKTLSPNAFVSNMQPASIVVNVNEGNPYRTYVEVDKFVGNKWQKIVGNWSTGVAANTATLSVPAGTLEENAKYQVKISTDDAAGYHGGDVVPFMVDNTPPTITVKSGYVGSLSANVFSNVSFKLHDAHQVDKYILNNWSSDFTNNNNSDANFGNIRSHLIQGTNTLTLYDAAGNSKSYIFTYDNVAPVISTTVTDSTVNGLVVLDMSTIGEVNPKNVNVRVLNPDNTVAKYTDGTNVPGVYSQSNTTNSVSFNWDTTKMPNGIYRIQFSARDAAGNPAISVFRTLTVTNQTTDQTGGGDSTGSDSSSNLDSNNKKANINSDDATSGSGDGRLTGPNRKALALFGATDGTVLGTSTTTPSADDKGQALGTSDTKSSNALNDDKGQVKGDSTTGTWNIFGVAWYWWLLLLAVIAAIWWWIAAARRRANEA